MFSRKQGAPVVSVIHNRNLLTISPFSGPIPAMTAWGGGAKNQNFPTIKPSTTVATTVAGIYVNSMHYMTDSYDRSNSSVTKI